MYIKRNTKTVSSPINATFDVDASPVLVVWRDGWDCHIYSNSLILINVSVYCDYIVLYTYWVLILISDVISL